MLPVTCHSWLKKAGILSNLAGLKSVAVPCNAIGIQWKLISAIPQEAGLTAANRAKKNYPRADGTLFLSSNIHCSQVTRILTSLLPGNFMTLSDSFNRMLKW